MIESVSPHHSLLSLENRLFILLQFFHTKNHHVPIPAHNKIFFHRDFFSFFSDEDESHSFASFLAFLFLSQRLNNKIPAPIHVATKIGVLCSLIRSRVLLPHSLIFSRNQDLIGSISASSFSNVLSSC